MKITRISLFVVPLDSWEVNTRYVAQDNLQATLETTIVRIDTDAGLVGWGETCTAPSYYLPTLASGARAAIGFVAGLLIGEDPRHPRRLITLVATAMRGQYPARSALDMALRDLHGKILGAPLVDLWGGRVSDALDMMCLVNMGTPDEMLAETAAYRADGYRKFQMKIGDGPPEEDVARIEALMSDRRPGERFWFDANRGWTVDHALEVIPRVAHLHPLMEQPCETYEECRTVAQRCGIGLMLDESMTCQADMIRAADDGVLRVAVLKFSCTGGLTEHRHMAETGLRLGVPMRIEDFYGTALTFAAVAHLCHSLPETACFGLYDYNHPKVPVALNPLVVRDGRVALPNDVGPGLGVEVNEAFLGDPVAVYS